MTSSFNKLNIYKLILFITCYCFVWVPTTKAEKPSDSLKDYEQHEVEYAILFRLLNFIEWPEKQEQLRFGIIGSTELFDSAKEMVRALPNSERFVLFHLDESCPKGIINELSLLYVGNQTHLEVDTISKELGNLPILLVGSQSKFLENGGIVNFVDHNGRTAFEINLIRSNQVGISFRAKLLRLALRVIK